MQPMSDAACDTNVIELCKPCSYCKQSKPLSQFVKRKAAKDGMANGCRTCVYAYQAEWRKKNRGKHRAMQKRAEAKERAKRQAARVALGKPIFGQKNIGDTRWCATCKVYKPKTEFHRQKDGLHAHCKPCSTIKTAEWVKKNRARRSHLMRAAGLRRYGLTHEAFDALCQAQGGRCAICRNILEHGRSGGSAVDHDHVTGAVRGILCTPCNTGIGAMRDSEEFLQRAIDYLKRSRGG